MRATTLFGAAGIFLVALAPCFADRVVLPRPRPVVGGFTTASVPAKVDAAAVYSQQCSACHQPQGEGAPETFPPLAGNRDLFLSADFLVRVILYGMKGKVDVNGKSFDGEMPPLNVLSDAQIAAVLGYVRGAWGNAALAPKDMAPVDAAAVAKLRRLKDVVPEQVHALRAKLKAAAGR
jgi:mono/diheme cytochrome c family protein